MNSQPPAPIVVRYFSHDTCNVCKVLRPKLETLTAEFDQVRFEYIKTDEQPEEAAQNLVFAVPTIIVLVEGKEGRRFGRHLAMAEYEEYLNRLNRLFQPEQTD